MAQWENSVLTNAGFTLLQRCLGGEQLFLDHAVGGTGQTDPAQLPELIALENQVQQLPIIQQKPLYNGRQVGSLITNMELNYGYQMTQYGIYAHIGADPPVLMAVLQDSVGLSIPSKTDIPEFHFVYYCIIDFVSAAVWHYTLEPSLMKPRIEPIDPSPGTPGTLSQFYVNSDTGSLFVCIDTGGGQHYTWLEVVRGTSTSGAAVCGAAYVGASYLMKPTI